MEWRAKVASTFGELRAKTSRPETYKAALFGLWSLAESAPAKIRDLYRIFDEAELREGAERVDPSKLFEPPAPSDGGSSADDRLFRDLAVRIRAVEEYLLTEAHDAGPQRTASECEVSFAGASGYLLLRPPRNREPKMGDPFVRRGLRGSRIFPKRLGDFDVELTILEDAVGRLRAREPRPLRFAGGLFEEFDLNPQPVEAGFVVTAPRARDQFDTVRKHVALSSREACIGLAYPELSMGEGLVRDVATSLGGEWDSTLSLVVAGSCHSRDGKGAFNNVCTVLDAYGNTACRHLKFHRFLDLDGSKEAIEPGNSIQVLVLEQAVLTFAICLDFCHLFEANPYVSLDIDYVVVPSCGGASTIEAHIDRSEDLLRRLKSRTVVIQQFHTGKSDPSDPLGYVFARTGSETMTESEARSFKSWTVKTI